MTTDISPGKSMLLQLRGERHAAEHTKQEEFAFEARQNFEHSLKVRQGLTGRARSGGDGGIFGGDNQGAALQKQGKPRPDAPFAVSDSPMFDRQQAKENYADQYNEYQSNDDDEAASYGGRGGARAAYGYPSQMEDQGAPSPRGTAVNTADQYEAMLKAAEMKRIRNKTAPRSTALW